jgi:hypothetical protein
MLGLPLWLSMDIKIQRMYGIISPLRSNAVELPYDRTSSLVLVPEKSCITRAHPAKYLYPFHVAWSSIFSR